MNVSSATPVITFAQGRPFYTMITTFVAATVGLGPLFDTKNPLGLNASQAAWYAGKIWPSVAIDMDQVLQPIRSHTLSADGAVQALWLHAGEHGL